MKLSRLLGAAVTWGALCGGSALQAQYYPMTNGAYPAQYPMTAPAQSYYPATPSAYGYVASLPGGAPMLSGPSNGPVGPITASNGSYVGTTPVTAFPASMQSQPTPAVGGGLNSASPSDLPYGASASPPAYASGAYASGAYAQPTIGYGGAGCATGQGMGYGYQGGYGGGYGAGSCDVGGGAFQPFDSGAGYVGPNRWYAGAYGMVLTRDTTDHFTFSYDTANEALQYTDAKDAKFGYGGGFATVFGRYFNCGQNAIEAVYWGWFPEQASVYTYGSSMTGNLNGILNWDSLTYNGNNMGIYVNDASVHALMRDTEAHNVEVNLLSFSGNCGSTCGPSTLRYSWLAGFRYFRFRDQLQFLSDPNDIYFTGETDEIRYKINTINSLIGFQVGGVGTYCVGPRFALNAGSKLGIYGNSIRHESDIYGSAGTAVINNGPNNGRSFMVHNNKEDVSFLGELFVGGSYCLTNRWTLSGGYRAIAVTGLASPTDQIYPDLRGINDLYTIESTSSLILHGAYFGAQYCF